MFELPEPAFHNYHSPKPVFYFNLKVIPRIFYSSKAGVKLTHIVGLTMRADKSWTIWHPISTMWKRVWSTWSHKICILVSVQHFSPTNVCVMRSPKLTYITNEQLESQLNSRSCKHGGSLLDVAVVLICQWIQAHGRSGTWTVLETSSLPQFEKTSLKSEKKYKNHRQAEYHHTLKMKKTLSSAVARDSNLGPLVYEASVLPTELSFRMKNWVKIMTIYIWFVVQQMWVSLTYPFNIVQHTLSHIVEHRKLDSLATPDNNV